MRTAPSSVRCTWECNFCHKEAETRGTTPVNGGIEAKLPERWDEVRLYGQTWSEVTQFGGGQREEKALLCPTCLQVYYKYVGEMTQFAADFWWSRVRFIARGEEPRKIELPWAREDRKKDPRNCD